MPDDEALHEFSFLLPQEFVSQIRSSLARIASCLLVHKLGSRLVDLIVIGFVPSNANHRM